MTPGPGNSLAPPSTSEATSASADRPSRSLVHDEVVRGLALLLALAALPIVAPILSAGWRAGYGQHVIDVPFLVALLAALRHRIRGVTGEIERRFWRLLTFGFACWLGTLVINIVYDDPVGASMIRQVVNNVPYLMFYGAIAMALETHPHVRSESMGGRLRGLERIGSFLLVFGLLLYFLILPGLARSEAFWASSLGLFVALDAYLILRLASLQQATPDAEWRSIYSWLLVGAALWWARDLGLMLMFEGFLTDPGFGSVFDLILPLAFCAVVVATRVRGPEPEARPVLLPVRERIGMGPLVAYAVLPPLLHISIYRFASPDPGVRPARELAVMAFGALLGVTTFAYHTLLRIENRRLTEEEEQDREKLAYLAFHDELTGLPNREMFQDHLRLAIADAKRYRRKSAVLFCDLDRFKVINDSLGHEAGDQVLVATAERLLSTVRVLDTVARFGGDEFTIILHGIRGALDAARLAEKMLDALSEPLVVQGKKHSLTASVGIAVFPDDGEDEATLLKNADTAMYQAKIQGRSTYRLFTEAMNEAAEERLAIERGLRRASIEDSFVVFYQPMVDIATRAPVGYEALLRWNHPERGFVAPGSFLEVAEHTGLIVPIGRWVLETACTWAAEMGSDSPHDPWVAVNLSRRQVEEPGLVRDVITILERTGLEPARLQLEITESLAFAIDSTAPVLSELRDLGIRIAVDDFGTGFAALTRLTGLPVDLVKIDHSFVRGVEVDSVGEAIIRAIVTMARALDFYVVAEGVETEAEYEVVRQLECDAVQGFFIQDPMPPDELEEVMARWLKEGNKWS